MNPSSVVPAKAGNQRLSFELPARHWIPAFAGMTVCMCMAPIA